MDDPSGQEAKQMVANPDCRMVLGEQIYLPMVFASMRLLFVFALFSSAASAQTYPPEQIEFFERSIRPVLADHCIECHGKVRAEGSLRLDTRADVIKGGEGGIVVDAKNASSSRLLVAVRHAGAEQKIRDMPKNAPKLADDQIAALQRWIELGVPWPADPAPVLSKRDPRNHWSLKPVVAGQVIPEGTHPIDYFVQAGLRKKRLTPAPQAAPTTLVRRAYFVLTGLPPTQADLEKWTNLPISQLFDELLASPHYGERWARHWMDVARYSDVRGYTAGGKERRFIYAYAYRDWLIHAFNEDMPYDRFVRYQLAAEQLTNEADRGHLAAMGFLTLSDDAARREILIDDQIDATFRGLMALTVSCARCHDHKFDPIPTKDYYSLYGIFDNSVPPAEAPLLRAPVDTPEYRKFQADLAAKEKAIDDFLEPELAALAVQFPDLANRPFQLEGKLDRADQNKLRDLRTQREKFVADSTQAPDRARILEDRKPVGVARVFVRGNPGQRGDAVKPHFLTAVAGDDAPVFTKGSGRLELANAIVDAKNPLTARVMVNRVWMHHFGQGLVRTPSDFGIQGQAPDQPELLDWMADWFMSNGWSVKKLHRLILTSATWQQSSLHPNAPKQELVDAENRFLWHANLRRVDFETMRDSILAVSGHLDPKLYGRSVEIHEEPFSPRRTLYAYVDRQNLPQVFSTFDFASPQAHVAQRSYTTVSTQALFTMNSPFLLEEAQRIAALPGIAEAAPIEAVGALYRRLFAREPSEDEVALGTSFLAAQTEVAKQGNRQTMSGWQYGRSDPDPDTGGEKFVNFAVWQKDRWQPEAVYPAAGHLSHAHLHRYGGHPGGPKIATIARWTAPKDLSVVLDGTLRKASPKGNGVRARLLKNGGELLSEIICLPGQTVPTQYGPFQVAEGDTIDFRLDSMEDHAFDSFEWNPSVRSVSGSLVRWDYSKDFGGPVDLATPLQIYAQALVSTNEFSFVD